MSQVIHVFADTPHHYLPMQQFFELQCKPSCTQQFWVKSAQPVEGFITYANNDELFTLFNSLNKADNVVFHGLFDMHIWKKLLFNPIIKRSSCVLWGGELYRHTKPGRTLKQRIVHVLHALVIRRFNKVFALNPGDAQLAKTVLWRKNVAVLPYPLIGMKVASTTTPSEFSEQQPLKILVGNSAAPSNNHIDALNKLTHLANSNIQIVMPLNYGGEPNYVSDVISHANALFANKVHAITTMLSKQQYDALLNEVHLTVFAQQRQQGLYVAYAMLLMGKPLFLLDGTSSYSHLSTLGFDIYKTQKLTKFTFTELAYLANKQESKNASLMQQHFTEDALAPKWQAMLQNLHE
ncbi:TDP-N-acetylfucosamine:lipid II N-acetylfucosaminyltransferase [Pseudoalteromonas sp. Z1A8]|uniref:TDP-N-acetylfucosamine:lipid II N-acetylfucosaminyltransferase n=1 Tax=Pseudoalteromonas sp. Z1A8 TaxID=2686354 RepID=UPI00140E6558|nr:TDP-N-acetylfucosamine:lipid II N-acetylfucosaminyltransferase [Pseudoalteromonas sp. Z1A8]